MNAPTPPEAVHLAPSRQSFSGLAGVECPAWVHASAIALGERGLLITGAPGSGKSRLARQMIDLATAQGLFAAMAGDDRVLLRTAGGRLLASGHPAIDGRMELRGLGIMPCSAIKAVRIAAVVALLPPDCGILPRLPLQNAQMIEIPGSKIPEYGLEASTALSLPVAKALISLAAADYRGEILQI